MQRPNKQVTVFCEAVLLQGVNSLYKLDQIRTMPVFAQPKELFERIQIVARSRQTNQVLDYSEEFEPERVFVGPLPHYQGLKELLIKLPRLLLHIYKYTKQSSYFLLYLPGPIGLTAAFFLIARRKKFSVHLVGDVEQVLGSLYSGSQFTFASQIFVKATKFVCRRANNIAYVTRSTLQAKYPASELAKSYSFSDVDLSNSVLATLGKKFVAPAVATAVFCGSFEQIYKGFHILVDAVASSDFLRENLTVDVLGSGRLLGEMQDRCKAADVEANFRFRGSVARESVLAYLESADLFVMPSLTEGLPRAMIEAMAKGLPCIGSSVGGICELIDESARVHPGDVRALAEKITYFLTHPAMMNEQAERNLQTARGYEKSILSEQRSAFFKAIASAETKQ